MRIRALAASIAIVLLASCSDDGSVGPPEGESATDSTTSLAAEPSDDPAEPDTDPDELPHQVGDEDFLFDQEAVHTFTIDVDEDLLAQIDADPTAEEYVEATLHFNGDPIGTIGLRYKGSIGSFNGCTEVFGLQPSGAKTCRKLSMKLKIDWDDPEARFYDVKKVLLHAMVNDPSMMHERLGYWMFREMGVAAPRATHARVELNGEYLGLFALVEEIDGRFTRANFDDGTGNLYKEVWPLTTDGSPQAADTLIDSLQTNRDEDPTAALMVAFAEELVAAADLDERRAVVEKWTDIDALLRQIVVDRGIKHDDGPLHWYCFGPCEPHNFYWYEDPTSEQLSLIPWDLDLAFSVLSPSGMFDQFVRIPDAFGETSGDCQAVASGGFLQQRSAACDLLLATLASYDHEFDAIRQELVTGPLSAESVAAQIEMWSDLIAPAVIEEAELFDDATSPDTWRAAMEALETALAATLDDDGR